MDSNINRYRRSHELFARAAQVIPCGIYGHASPAAALPGALPYYADRAAGCRYWDVDGNEYIDYLCGYGPVILGHQHPAVEEAAARQQGKALCVNHPAPVMVELAEYLVSLVEFSAWAVFGKNGSDMTTWCVQVARARITASILGVHPATPACWMRTVLTSTISTGTISNPSSGCSHGTAATSQASS